MIQIGIICLAMLSTVNLVLTILALKRIAESRQDRDNQPLQDELRLLREAVSRSEQEIRNEIRKGHENTTKILMGNIGEFGKLLTTQAEGMRNTVDKRFQDLQGSMETRLEKIRETVTAQLTNGTKAINDLTESNETRMDKVRTTVDERLQDLQGSMETRLEKIRETVTAQLTNGTKAINDLTQSNETRMDKVRTTVDERLQDLQGSMETRLEKIRETVTAQLTNGTKAINDLTQSNETRMDKVRTTVDERLQAMQKSNEGRLDDMRKTVDEKLQSTLEKRLGESFNQVRKQLEDVHRGLGEMQELATGVGDLKRVLTNVKTRGTWGEVQLGALLEEILTPDQYDSNVQLNEDSRELVEYAIRLPGSDDDPTLLCLVADRFQVPSSGLREVGGSVRDG